MSGERRIIGMATLDLTNFGDQSISIDPAAAAGGYIVSAVYVRNVNPSNLNKVIPGTVVATGTGGSGPITGGMSGATISSLDDVQQITPGPMMLDGSGSAKVLYNTTLYAKLSNLGFQWPAGATGGIYIEASVL
jgi:hypothetical protein